MALDLRLSKSLSVQGKTFNFSRSAPADGPAGKEPSLAAAKAGSLSTRTNNTAGVLTLATGHGFANTNVADVYWQDAAGVSGVAYKATLSAVNTTSATFTAAGVRTSDGADVLPLVNTTVTAMLVHQETLAITAADLQALACYAGGVPMVARFVSSAPADVAVIVVSPGNEGYVWWADDDSGSANPFGSTDIASVYLTHGSKDGTVAPAAYAYVN